MGQRPVNGTQFEITSGPARAVVNEVGAGLRVLEFGGIGYLETYPVDQRPPMSAGAVLVPWPNRVLDGRWSWHGEPQQLALTEPARRNAIHGLGRFLSWRLAEHGADSVTLETDLNVQPGWPVPLQSSVRYQLADGGLTITHTVHNRGARSVPFGLGVHPYLRAADTPVDDCVLTLAASTMLPMDRERMVPSGPALPVDGTGYDFRAGRPLAGVELDDPFGGCVPDPDGLVRHWLTGPSGAAVQVWADPVFRWVQVYTPGDFAGRGRAVAIEPMTCPPNALDSGVDLIELEPDQRWTASWGISPGGRRA